MKRVATFALILIGIAAAIYFVVHRHVSSDGTDAAASPSATQTLNPGPTADEKSKLVNNYYSDISKPDFRDAYDLLASGSFPSVDALSNRYCGVASVDVTSAENVADAPAMQVALVAHPKIGDQTTTYTGTIGFSYDSGSNAWRMNRPNLTRNEDDPKLIGEPCATAEATAAPTPGSEIAAEPRLMAHAAVAERAHETFDVTNLGSGVTYSMSGSGHSTYMTLTVENDTEVDVDVTIKRGTRAVTNDAGVQSMVVTDDDFEIELEPHAKKSTKIDVACLDIALAPPGDNNQSWTLSASPDLRNFIDCTGFATEPGALQFAIWDARGASHEQLVDFFTEYHSIPTPDAEATATKTLSALQDTVSKCGSLSSL